MKSLLLLTLESLSEEAIIKTIKTEIELLTDVKMIHFYGKVLQEQITRIIYPFQESIS